MKAYYHLYLAVYEERKIQGAMQWLRRLVAGLSSRRPGFNSKPVCVGFMADKFALGQVFLRVPPFPLCHSTDGLCSLFICYQCCVIAAVDNIINST
jgi:hypothetical protein